jgi:tetratricopeptide (TPR) repeat protein
MQRGKVGPASQEIPTIRAMAPKDQAISYIRFQLDQLSVRNEHHSFEHLCRHLARARICSNILPATGPVSSGGDQGRDFETFRTYLSRSAIAGSSFVGLASAEAIAFACTLTQKENLASKIKEDVAVIAGGRAHLEGIHYFCSSDLPVAHRHKLQDWASEAHGTPLEIYDGQAISELLAEGDVFWIATRFLAVPGEIFSAIPERGLRNLLLRPEDVSIAKLPISGELLFGRQSEIAILDKAWHSPGVNVLSVVAWGGVGKTALVNHWLARTAEEHYRGAKRVYGWSFYSQGSHGAATSADQFIDQALRFFGDENPAAGLPWDRGERLARLVRQERTLLVLDGLEPLQFPPGPEEGRFKDPALSALVRELAAYNPGLCLITSRIPATELAHYAHSTAPIIALENLSEEAGAALLRALEVQGTQEEMARASREFGGHGLALNLLGTYLRDVHDGDVGCRSRVQLKEQDEEEGGHAWRVMASYEIWFGKGPELFILRLLGLFERPASEELIDVLLSSPPIPGLNDSLLGLDRGQWRKALARLRRAGLLSESRLDDKGILDTHPLVREYFANQLRTDHPSAWREGHRRLYEHLRTTAKQFPDTLEELLPLFYSVAHACRAGLAQEALYEVYWERILRKEEQFSWKKLGAFGADLAAMAAFFDHTWDRPTAEITDEVKAFVLNQAGVYLRASGRMHEAAQPFRASLEVCTALGDWKQAAIRAGNLSELSLITGELGAAVTYAELSVSLARRSHLDEEVMKDLTVLADALHQVGRLEESRSAFTEAEVIQGRLYHECPFLSGLRGYRYNDLLLGEVESVALVPTAVRIASIQTKCRDVQKRAETTLAWFKEQYPLLDIALDHLILGRVHLLRERLDLREDGRDARDLMDQAVHGLRLAGTQQYLPLGLIHRAALYRQRDLFSKALADLQEATDIVARGEMRLYEADILLELARLFLKQGSIELAREHVERARSMIVDMGYLRRQQEVHLLERAS